MPHLRRALFEPLLGSPLWVRIANGLLLFSFRSYVAWVFFAAGLIKVGNFETARALFESEYNVPLLAPSVAAWLSTGIELLVPPLLAIGLGVRPLALLLFAFNYVAAVSYPDISPAGVKDHVLWGTLLAVLALQGGGPFALDRLLASRLTRNEADEARKFSTRAPVSD